MLTVRFYGSLKRFGSTFRLNAETIAECLNALMQMKQGLKPHFMRGLFKVRIGSQRYLDNRFLEKGMHEVLNDETVIHVVPVVKGAKKAGVFQTIVGAVMVVAGALTSWAGGGFLIAAGIGLMAGGVAQMLTKTPNANYNSDRNDKKQSTAFGNIVNMAAQGQSMPLCYGTFRCGSMVLSQGARTYDAESEAVEKPAERRLTGLFSK